MNKIGVWMSLIIVFLVASLFYKKWAINQALKKLHEVQVHGTKKEFMSAVDTDMSKFYFNDYTRLMMKLNYLFAHGTEEEVSSLLSEFKTVKMKDHEKRVLFTRMFGYYVEHGKTDRAKTIYDRLQKQLANQNNQESLALKQEIEEVKAVYLEPNSEYCAVLEEYIAQDSNPAMKTIHLYRLARLKHVFGDDGSAEKLLNQAIIETHDTEEKNRLSKILGNLKNWK